MLQRPPPRYTRLPSDMPRRLWIVPLLLASACGPPRPDAASLLPPTVAVVWQRKSLHEIPPPQASVTRAVEAAYEGAGQITARIYATKSPGSAFEMTQHWKEQKNTVFFDKGRYFVVVEWQQADRNALTAFVRALEKELDRVR